MRIQGTLVEDIALLPKASHWQIITTETYTPYDGYNNDGTARKLMVYVYSDRETWVNDVTVLTQAGHKFYAVQVNPAHIRTTITVDG
jgi:hypothetical protein